jgi:hypothetical protein
MIEIGAVFILLEKRHRKTLICMKELSSKQTDD